MLEVHVFLEEVSIRLGVFLELEIDLSRFIFLMESV